MSAGSQLRNTVKLLLHRSVADIEALGKALSRQSAEGRSDNTLTRVMVKEGITNRFADIPQLRVRSLMIRQALVAVSATDFGLPKEACFAPA